MLQENSSNSKQAAWVAIGTFFSFIVGIVTPMILSRYFNKGDYGTYKQVMYVYHTLLTVFTLGLPKAYAYFLPKYPTTFSRDIISKVTNIFFVLGGIFSVCLVLFSGVIASLMNNPDLKMALIVFSPTPFLLLPTMGLDGIFASFRQTKYLAYYTIVTRLLTIVCIILPVVLFSGSYIHAIIGFDIASLVTFLIALYLKSWPVRNVEHQKSSLPYRDIFKFSIPLLYASIWGMIIVSANQFFISRYYGNEVFAEFSNGFMEFPFVGMILGSISAILLPLFSGKDKGDGINYETLDIWHSALLKSAKLIFPMLAFCIFFAEPLMTCMYGDLYAASSVYFVIKNISGFFYIIPFYPIILAIGKTKEYAHVHMWVAFVVVVIEYVVCMTCDSAIYVAIASEVCQLLKVLLLMRVIADYGHKRIIDLLPPKPLGRILLIAMIAAFIPQSLLSLVDLNKYTMLLVGLTLFLINYFLLCWGFRVSYREIVSGFIKSRSRLSSVVKLLP